MSNPYDHNPYIAMLDTAQARIAALEAEKAALQAKLRELWTHADYTVRAHEPIDDETPAFLHDLKAAVAAAKEALQ